MSCVMRLRPFSQTREGGQVTPTITDDSTRIVRDRRFSLDAGDESILAALAHLRREAVTGQLILDLSQGGLCSLRFREERKIAFDEK